MGALCGAGLPRWGYSKQADPRRPAAQVPPERGCLPRERPGKRTAPPHGRPRRNARLTATRSLFRYAAPRAPEHPAVISPVLDIPSKRSDRAIVSFLTSDEIDALLAAPGQDSWLAHRDRALLLVAIQTGLRVSELTGLTVSDVHLGLGAHVRCHSKGRKVRATPLTPQTTAVLRAWLAERGRTPGDPLFPARSGRTSWLAGHRYPARMRPGPACGAQPAGAQACAGYRGHPWRGGPDSRT